MSKLAKLSNGWLKLGEFEWWSKTTVQFRPCKAVRQKWDEWEAKGLYLFFLPKYCSEMNPIEPEWHQLKAHEICGRMFEHELDLAYAVINGVEARAEAGEYSTERFKFPSQLAAS